MGCVLAGFLIGVIILHYSLPWGGVWMLLYVATVSLIEWKVDPWGDETVSKGAG